MMGFDVSSCLGCAQIHDFNRVDQGYGYSAPFAKGYEMTGFEVRQKEHSMTDSTKPQLADIAARAGVSLATVDRVINRRKCVKERTRGRVLEIAREIGFLAAEDAEL
ncbi:MULTISPECIES: helix-turn-helix domain-containing protein [unclassified Mameliella]|uniref:helix-turn-helix domain-containing protein n=2 Tax=Mameliella TaxID=1434019 RepID=UPI00273D2212|nr:MULTISPECIES: helix-turn-helix domain-containing protein [unclassified Mameliella]